MSETKNVAGTLKDEVRAILGDQGARGGYLSTREVYDLAKLAEHPDQVSQALYDLRKSGEVERDTSTRPHRYRLVPEAEPWSQPVATREEAAARMRSPGEIATLLYLAGLSVPEEVIGGWTDDERTAAVLWAWAVHEAAVDNGVVVPRRPGCLDGFELPPNPSPAVAVWSPVRTELSTDDLEVALLGAGYDVPAEVIRGWSPAVRGQVERWLAAGVTGPVPLLLLGYGRPPAKDLVAELLEENAADVWGAVAEYAERLGDQVLLALLDAAECARTALDAYRAGRPARREAA